MGNVPVKLQEIIGGAVIETFENMAFMEVVQKDEETPERETPDTLKATLLVHDPFPGELRLIVPKELAAEIGQVIYSTIHDEEIADQVLFDVLAELLNTIAGSVVAEIVPEEQSFRLGIPEIGAEAFLEADIPSIRCGFELEGQYFTVIACGETFLGMESES